MAFALLLALPLKTALAQSENPPDQPSLTQQIEKLKTKAMLLVQRLNERDRQVTELTASLEQARQSSADSAASSETLAQQLDAARTERDNLRKELLETLSSLARLQETQKRSESAWRDYRTEVAKQLDQFRTERNTWSWIGWTGVGATLGALGGSAIGKDFGSSAIGALAGAALAAAGKWILEIARPPP